MTTLATTVAVEKRGETCGAEITGVDLTRADLLSDADVQTIKQALWEHGVIYLRGERLDEDQYMTFVRRLGTPSGGSGTYKVDGGAKKYPELLRIIKEADHSFNLGGMWHQDVTFRPIVGGMVALYGHQVPPYGGQTRFASLAGAYDALSDEYKKMLAGMSAVHVNGGESVPGSQWAQRRALSALGPADMSKAVRHEAIHPLVWTHPKTGRKSLFFNPQDLDADFPYTHSISGMTVEESRPIMRFLADHITQDGNVFQMEWEPGSVVIWDNRYVLHNALNNYHGHRREMWRVSIDD